MGHRSYARKQKEPGHSRIITEAGMEFELQPTLTGSLLELRPLTPADFNALFIAAGDPLIWEQHPQRDRYKREIFQKYFDSAMESKGALAAIDRKTSRIIGSSRYHNLQPQREVEIGWTFLERAYWGGTCNGELKALMVDHALRFVRRVVFVVGETNLRSQKALRKIGARTVGKTERSLTGGIPLPHLIFAIERAERDAITDPRP